MIVCFLGYLLAVSVFFTTFVRKIYVVLKMEKVYAHRESGVEANIIGCATYDLKLGKFKPQYKGQMELYLKYMQKYDLQPGENPPIGLLLCSEGNTEHIELLMLDEDNIKVAQYLTCLPNKQWFIDKLNRSILIAKEFKSTND